MRYVLCFGSVVSRFWFHLFPPFEERTVEHDLAIAGLTIDIAPQAAHPCRGAAQLQTALTNCERQPRTFDVAFEAHHSLRRHPRSAPHEAEVEPSNDSDDVFER